MPARSYLIIENASIHKTKAIKEFAEKNNMSLVFNVPYSPLLNGIEEIWANAKHNFKKEMLKS